MQYGKTNVIVTLSFKDFIYYGQVVITLVGMW